LRQAVWLGVALLVLVIFSPGQFLGARGGGHAWLWPALSALLLLPFVFSGVRAIAEERERGALGVLLAQPLSGASVIGGKTKACFARAALPFAGVLAVSVAFACARCLPPAAPLLLALLLPAGALFLYGAGLVAGLLCSGAPAALAWCCVFCAVVEAGAVGLGAILCGFEVGVMRTGLFYWLVPGWPDLLQNGGLDRGGWLAAVVALGGRAGLGIAACFWAMRRFDRWTGRA